MRERLRTFWPYIKAVLALVIVTLVSRRFYFDLRDCPEIWQAPRNPLALVLSGVLYLLGLAVSAGVWYRLLQSLGQQPSLVQTLRAYYLGHLGKYVPGKAYALILRADLARSSHVRAGVAGLTAFYEVLLTMASGAVVAVVLFLFCLPEQGSPPDWGRLVDLVRGAASSESPLDRTLAVVFAAGLAIPLLVATYPPVFNGLARRASLPFRDRARELPRFGFVDWVSGLTRSILCWCCLGASLGAAIYGFFGHVAFGTPGDTGLLIAAMATVYVAGFLVLVVPGALGVREYFLMVFLAAAPGLLPLSETDRTQQAQFLAAGLRVVWTAAEFGLAAIVWPWTSGFSRE